jgi:hypothetical protein
MNKITVELPYKPLEYYQNTIDELDIELNQIEKREKEIYKLKTDLVSQYVWWYLEQNGIWLRDWYGFHGTTKRVIHIQKHDHYSWGTWEDNTGGQGGYREEDSCLLNELLYKKLIPVTWAMFFQLLEVFFQLLEVNPNE